MPEEDLQVKVEKLERLLRLERAKADHVSRNIHYKQNLKDFVKESMETGTTASGRIFQLMGTIPGARKRKAD